MNQAAETPGGSQQPDDSDWSAGEDMKEKEQPLHPKVSGSPDALYAHFTPISDLSLASHLPYFSHVPDERAFRLHRLYGQRRSILVFTICFAILVIAASFIEEYKGYRDAFPLFVLLLGRMVPLIILIVWIARPAPSPTWVITWPVLALTLMCLIVLSFPVVDFWCAAVEIDPTVSLRACEPLVSGGFVPFVATFFVLITPFVLHYGMGVTWRSIVVSTFLVITAFLAFEMPYVAPERVALPVVMMILYILLSLAVIWVSEKRERLVFRREAAMRRKLTSLIQYNVGRMVRLESQQRMNELVKQSPTMFAEVDIEGVIRYASPAAKSIFGIDGSDLIGMDITQLIAEEDRPVAQQVYARLRQLSYRAREDPSICAKSYTRSRFRRLRRGSDAVWVEHDAQLTRRAGREPCIIVRERNLSYELDGVVSEGSIHAHIDEVTWTSPTNAKSLNNLKKTGTFDPTFEDAFSYILNAILAFENFDIRASSKEGSISTMGQSALKDLLRTISRDTLFLFIQRSACVPSYQASYIGVRTALEPIVALLDDAFDQQQLVESISSISPNIAIQGEKEHFKILMWLSMTSLLISFETQLGIPTEATVRRKPSNGILSMEASSKYASDSSRIEGLSIHLTIKPRDTTSSDIPSKESLQSLLSMPNHLRLYNENWTTIREEVQLQKLLCTSILHATNHLASNLGATIFVVGAGQIRLDIPDNIISHGSEAGRCKPQHDELKAILKERSSASTVASQSITSSATHRTSAAAADTRKEEKTTKHTTPPTSHQPSQQPSAKPAAQQAVQTERRLAGVRVLFVDDERVNRRLGSRMLQRLGCRYALLEDGDQVRTALQAESYDLIVIDIVMQRTDGATVCQELREEGVDLPIVAMTGNTSARDVQRFMQAGFDMVLAKPFDIHGLERALREAPQRRERIKARQAAAAAAAVKQSEE